MGVTIRHYFNTMHRRRRDPTWTWPATAIIFVVIMWLSTAPGSQREELAGLSPMQQKFAARGGFRRRLRCGARPLLDVPHGRAGLAGIHHAPKGVILDNRGRHRPARARDLPAGGRTHAMPPANVTDMRAGGAQDHHRLVPRRGLRLRPLRPP